MLNAIPEIHNTFCGINNCDSSSISFEYCVWNSLFLYCNNFVYIVFLWLIQHHIVTLSKFWMCGIYSIIICIYVSIYILFTSLSSRSLLWIGYGITVGLILALLPLTWTHYVWNKLKDPYEEQDNILEPSNKFLRFLYRASLKVVWSASTRTVIYLVVCVSLTVCTMLELVGPFAWIRCNIETVPCRFNSHVDTLTVKCLKQPARVLNTEQLKTHKHWKVRL
jgi:hypothetical protein